MTFFGLTDRGRKRDDNEDRFVCSNENGYCILADGMGGRLFGEVASEMAVEILGRHLDHDLPAGFGRMERADQAAVAINLMDDWVRHVNACIHRRGIEDERYREMGTTLVCLLALEKQLVRAHVGDSRVYRLRAGVLEQITEDHSLVNSQVKAGEMTAAEARDSSQKNIITRALGAASAVKPEIAALPLQSGDVFLCCSDGLSDMVPDDRIREVLSKATGLEAMAKTLIAEANANGGRDNITAIVAEWREG